MCCVGIIEDCIKSKRKYLLKEYLVDNKIDILGIQEIKYKKFSERTLNFLSHSISTWYFKPSIGNFGGMLVGVNIDIFSILDKKNLRFYYIHLKNKNDNFSWFFTVVYEPVLSSQKSSFLVELKFIHTFCDKARLVCGDFNMIRRRDERRGQTFNYIVSNRFNSVINELELIEYKLVDSKFSWSKSVFSDAFALLDRFFYTTE